MKKIAEQDGEFSRVVILEPDTPIMNKTEALKFVLRVLQDPFVKNPTGEVVDDAESDTKDYFSFKSVDDCFNNLEAIASIDIDVFRVDFLSDGKPVFVAFAFPCTVRGEKRGLRVTVLTDPGHNVDNWAENLDKE